VPGYADRQYAYALSEFGTPRELPHCGGWVLERSIDGVGSRDAMGCYPLFSCSDWSRLHTDVNMLAGDLVTLSLVTDPFGSYDQEYLQTCFDSVVPFKQHFIYDLSQPPDHAVRSHHRYYARRALDTISVEVCTNPLAFLDDWTRLYRMLSDRHQLKDIKAFSTESFAKQLTTPGIVALRAVSQDAVVGGHLWYMQGDVAYSHLTAFSPRGYELMTSYALYWFALQYFAGLVRWLNLGAGAGLMANSLDGLAQFKRGWSTGTRLAYFCGRIFDHSRYDQIVARTGAPATRYFPAYRAGELANE
jgi:Acetyltransferase (GNAT) domain